MCENKLENDKNCSTFCDELKIAGATTSQNEGLNCMLNTMPEKENYENIDEIVGILKEEENRNLKGQITNLPLRATDP